MSMLRRLRADRLCRRIDRNMTMAVRMLQSGRAHEACVCNDIAIATVHKVWRLEPDDPEHRRMLGSLHYNQAAIFEQLDRLDAAVAQARLALSYYETLPGGDMAPGNVPMLSLLNIRATFGPPSLDPSATMDLVAMVADVKARLARLLARHSAAGAAAEVHELGSSAVAAYEQLVKIDTGRSGGLDRVRTQYAQARRALEDAA